MNLITRQITEPIDTDMPFNRDERENYPGRQSSQQNETILENRESGFEQPAI